MAAARITVLTTQVKRGSPEGEKADLSLGGISVGPRRRIPTVESSYPKSTLSINCARQLNGQMRQSICAGLHERVNRRIAMMETHWEEREGG